MTDAKQPSPTEALGALLKIGLQDYQGCAEWSELDIYCLHRLYADYSNDDLGFLLGRAARAVGLKARQLGLAKSAAYMLKHGGRFTNTRVAWNRGMKGLNLGGTATQFKPGNQPHTTLPIGTLRITKDGTLQRKISDKPGNPSVRWRGVHELVWTAANGPLPRGHIVVFKRGKWSNQEDRITLDCVECISLAENMRRNTKHRYPLEIVRLIALRGALTRQINKRKKLKGS